MPTRNVFAATIYIIALLTWHFLFDLFVRSPMRGRRSPPSLTPDTRRTDVSAEKTIKKKNKKKYNVRVRKQIVTYFLLSFFTFRVAKADCKGVPRDGRSRETRDRCAPDDSTDGNRWPTVGPRPYRDRRHIPTFARPRNYTSSSSIHNNNIIVILSCLLFAYRNGRSFSIVARGDGPKWVIFFFFSKSPRKTNRLQKYFYHRTRALIENYYVRVFTGCLTAISPIRTGAKIGESPWRTLYTQINVKYKWL